jgi:uncharacterized Zn-finger protein
MDNSLVMKNKKSIICPKCKRKQTIETLLTIHDFSHEEFTFNNEFVNTSENNETKINCCAYCNTSFFGSYEEQIID